MTIIVEQFAEKDYQNFLSDKRGSIRLEGSNGFSSLEIDISSASIYEGDHLSQFIASKLIQSLETDQEKLVDVIRLSKHFQVVSSLTSFVAVDKETPSDVQPGEWEDLPKVVEPILENEAKIDDSKRLENIERLFGDFKGADFKFPMEAIINWKCSTAEEVEEIESCNDDFVTLGLANNSSKDTLPSLNKRRNKEAELSRFIDAYLKEAYHRDSHNILKFLCVGDRSGISSFLKHIQNLYGSNPLNKANLWQRNIFRELVISTRRIVELCHLWRKNLRANTFLSPDRITDIFKVELRSVSDQDPNLIALLREIPTDPMMVETRKIAEGVFSSS